MLPKRNALTTKRHSGWVNDGQNHIEVITWDLEDSIDKEIRSDLIILANKYPGLRFSLQAYGYKTRDQLLREMEDIRSNDK